MLSISLRGPEEELAIGKQCMWILKCSAHELYSGSLIIALRTGGDSPITFGTGTMTR
jgi:hypothetical protein